MGLYRLKDSPQRTGISWRSTVFLKEIACYRIRTSTGIYHWLIDTASTNSRLPTFVYARLFLAPPELWHCYRDR